jgi:hypothetical protein
MRILLLLLSLVAFTGIHAADDPRLTRVRAADDERVAATIAADRTRLDAVLSDDLRYAHSSGTVDTKASFIDALVSGRSKYEIIDYVERSFTFPAPGIVLMSGRAHFKVGNAKGGMDAVLGFLAVWREEKGRWRFLAWQSCKLPPGPQPQGSAVLPQPESNPKQ